MKLTVKNLQTEYASIREKMPQELNAQFDAIMPCFEFYGEDEQSTKAIDTFIEVANKILAKQTTEKPEPKPSNEPKDIALHWDIVADKYSLSIDYKFVEGSECKSVDALAEYIKKNYPSFMKRADVLAQLKNYGWKSKNTTSKPKPEPEPKPKGKTAKDITSCGELVGKVGYSEAEKIGKMAEKDAEKHSYECDVLRLERRYKDAIKTNDYEDMLFVLYYLEACNFHTEYKYFEEQKWLSLHKYLKGGEKPKPKYAVGDWVKVKIANSNSFVVWQITKLKVFSAKEIFYAFTSHPNEDEWVFEENIIGKTTAPNNEPKPKAEKPVTYVNAISPAVKFIARYAKLHNKQYSGKVKEEVRKLLTALQRAILNLEVRKTDVYAKELNDIQDSLIAVLKNRANDSYTLDIKNIEHYREIAGGVKVSSVVALLQKYIRLVGKDGVKADAKKLLEKLQSVSKGDYNQQAADAIMSLQRYIDGKDDYVTASQETLEGLYGLCGIDEEPQRSHSMNAAQLSNTYFRTINLSGKWRNIIGKPSSPYRLMIYGKAGSGKSTLALQYAGYLAEDLGQKVLYVASEEGLTYTLKDKLSRLGIHTANLQIVDAMPKSVQGYDTVFIDSVNFAGYDAAELRKLNPKCSYVFVFQSTKQGNFRGTQEFLHDVDTCIRVENMEATTEKNRFGAQGTCRVL